MIYGGGERESTGGEKTRDAEINLGPVVQAPRATALV